MGVSRHVSFYYLFTNNSCCTVRFECQINISESEFESESDSECEYESSNSIMSCYPSHVVCIKFTLGYL